MKYGMIGVNIEGHGFYETSVDRFEKTLHTLAGVTVPRLRELLTEHTECNYSDISEMSVLLIIAAETELV